MERILDRILGENAYRYILRFLPYVKIHWRAGARAALLMVINALFQFALPLVTMYLIDHVFAGDQFNILYLICLGLLTLNIFYAISTFLQNFILLKIRNRILFKVRVDLFQHLTHLSLGFFQKKHSGYLTSRTLGDVGELQGFMAETLLAFIMDLLTFATGVILLFWLQPTLALICLCILPFFFLSLRIFNKRLRNLSAKSMEMYSRAYNTMQERFAGIYTIFGFGREKYEAMRCTRSLRESTKVQVKYEVSNAVAQMTSMLIGSLGPLAVLFYGGQEIMKGNMTIGEFYAFNAYLGYLFGPAQALTNLNFELQSSLAALGRIFELFDTKPEIREARSPVAVPGKLEDIVYSHVGFRYSTEMDLVLRDIDFKMKTGEFVALVGLSGAGKTTLVNLLPRFFDPVEGSILINGIDIREMDVQALRKIIGIVPQDVFLFDGTIEENIAYGDRWGGREAIVEAAKSANADGFISRLPQGYETEVGERGVKLSGGEKQRIAIARVAVRNPKILILDEATAALDSESEVLIQDALKELTRDKATIVIAHRLTTVLSATKILVLHNGKIIEMGTHPELCEQGGFYRKLYDTQFRRRTIDSQEQLVEN